MKQNFSEKRKLPRFLCHAVFKECSLGILNAHYAVTPINYHHQGIGLYTASPLPDVKAAMLIVNYQAEEESLKRLEFAVQIVHAIELDTGCQYGVSFDSKTKMNQALHTELLRIETILANTAGNDDRYGLFT